MGWMLVAFAAEETLVGVVGSFILDKYNENRDHFSFEIQIHDGGLRAAV